MRTLTPIPRLVALAALLLAPTRPLHAQVPTPAATPPASQPADSDGLLAYPDAPVGFNVRREGIPHGELTVVQYDSKSLGTRREMAVYTPPGYTKDRKYPVLYMLHGLGNSRTEWTDRAKAPLIVDNLLADGKIQPYIMVFPNGDVANTTTNPTPGRVQAGYGEPFTKDFLEDIIPYVDANYSTLADRKHRALGGMSMGGGQTLNIGLSHLDLFAWIGAVAAAPNTKPVAELIPDPEALKKLSLIYLAVGKQDGLMRINQGIHNFLTEKGIPHIWRNDEHAHDTAEMSNNLYYYAQKIFKE